MLTCKSPRTVLLLAHRLAMLCLPAFSCKYSRRDFTLPQLFACLVLREHQKKSYRGLIALLRDSPEWCAAIAMSKVPAASTLCNAFADLTQDPLLEAMLDQLARWMRREKHLGNLLAIDSTLMDVHYRSRHYEQRCRHYATRAKRSANQRRSRSAKRTPKLTVGVDTRSHMILSART